MQKKRNVCLSALNIFSWSYGYKLFPERIKWPLDDDERDIREQKWNEIEGKCSQDRVISCNSPSYQLYSSYHSAHCRVVFQWESLWEMAPLMEVN